jgi:hypothetical protein
LSRHIGAKKTDADAWKKICNVIEKPEYLFSQAKNLVEQLRTNAASLHEEKDRIEKELGKINASRQWVSHPG